MNTCPNCGETFESVGRHFRLSDCGQYITRLRHKEGDVIRDLGVRYTSP